jgi:hypothetical protein
MGLLPDEDILKKEIESWKGFADSLKSEEDKKLFLKMLNDCQKYAVVINAKETPLPTEPLIMALLLTQHKMIGWLSALFGNKQAQTNIRSLRKTTSYLFSD